MNILIIGGGNMGTTYARSFLKSQIVTHDDLMILENDPERRRVLKDLQAGIIYDDLMQCLPKADLIILAVKPQDSSVLFDTLRINGQNHPTYLSIMAGVKIETMARALDSDKIVRAMPNLPSQIREGMTVFTSTREVKREELLKIQNLLNTTGKTMYVEDENLLDSATAISGSGPAYVFYFMDALMDAARNLGFSAPEAELLVWQTFQGTANLFQKNNLSCEEWIQRVSSRGGTTEAAIRSFDSHQIRQSIMKGTEEAFRRAQELGKK